MRTHRLAAMSRLFSINIENNQFIKLLQQIVKDHLKAHFSFTQMRCIEKEWWRIAGSNR